MNTVIKDIASFIEQGSDWVFGTTLFGGREPSDPDNCMTLFDTPGGGSFVPLRRDPQGRRYEYAAFQIRVRNFNYDEAVRQSNDIIDVLHALQENTVVNGTLYTLIRALDNPHLLDWDENNRARIITNFEVQRTPQ